jgi:enterochelin esterase-like enzyme
VTRPLLSLFLIACALPLPAQPGGAVERIKVRGVSLEGNLEGDSPERDVSVYLPPSYAKDRSRRYPVVYLLHGFTDSDDKWFGLVKHWINLPQILDAAMASGASKEMIVVMPNAYTRYQGSMYSVSVTTGDWETYVARELVAAIDKRYRTLSTAASRGLAGHSMGGYGTLRIGMKYPEVFSSIYSLSPCCLWPPNPAQPRPGAAKAEAMRSPGEVQTADFMTKAQFASAAAWSPNPKNPPFFLDLPTRDGQPRADVLARWAANSPLALLDGLIPNLRRLAGLAFDAGDKDASIAASIRALDAALNNYGLAHDFEIYEGDHVNGVALRIEKKLLPFFSSKLAFTKPKR